jgi:transcriptional regulator with XRE-family HTH domain
MAETEALPSPESLLIRRARSALGLSPEKIVERMGVTARISSRYWRQIEDGQKIAPDDTYAHMANAVGLTPERLEEVGRPEAAEILREIDRMAGADRTDVSRRVDEQLDRNEAIVAEIGELLRQASPKQSKAILELLRALSAEDDQADAG